MGESLVGFFLCGGRGGGCEWKVESLIACQNFLKIPFKLLYSFHEVPLPLQPRESSRMKKTTVSSWHGILLTPDVLGPPTMTSSATLWTPTELYNSVLTLTTCTWQFPWGWGSVPLYCPHFQTPGVSENIGVSTRRQWAMAWNDILIPCPGIEPE